MAELVRDRMTADEFIEWSMRQPEGRRYELVAGEIVEMASERAIHGRVKFRITRLLQDAIVSTGLPCEVFADGMALRVDAHTVYEPDAMVRCGEPLPDEATEVLDPLILVEVRSPSTGFRDAGAKLEDYFRIPSVRHYLIVKTENRAVIHHQRDEAGVITTRILRDVPVPLDPPGIVLDNNFS